MRPLAVLILVLGAAAALLFAVTSLTGSDARQSNAAAPNVVQPTTADPRPSETVDPVVEPDVVRDEVPKTAPREAIEVEPGVAALGAFNNWIDGTVRDEQGVPIANAEVQLFERSVVSPFADVLLAMNGKGDDKPHKTTRTGGDGYFTFKKLSPGPNWSLVVTHEEFSRKEVGPVDVPQEGGIAEEVVLESGYVLQGYVREERTGGPVMRASVQLLNPALVFGPPRPGAPDASLAAAETDERGFFRFANVNPGQFALICTAPSYGTQIHYNINIAGAAERTVEKDFNLQPGTIIAGRVLGPDREGVEGVYIDAIGNSHDPGSKSSAVSKAGGEFVLENLNEGFYTLRMVAPGWDVDPMLRVEAGSTDVEIQLFEQGAVVGQVVDGETGRGLSDFGLIVRKLNKQSKAWGAKVAEQKFKGKKDGAFNLGGISEGTYVIQGDVRGYASSFSEPFTITQGMTTPDIVVRMTRGGTLKGRVIDSYTGDPIAGAEITTNDNNYIDSEFTALLSGLQPSALTRAKIRTDSEGRFEVKLMTPETYQVKVSAGGYTPSVTNNVRVGDGLPTDLGMVQLAKGATVVGFVYDSDGRPVKGCNVSLSRQDNRMWGNVQGRTDAQGRFELRNAPAGEYKLAASRPRSGSDNPFITILDMKNSEIELSVVDGQTVEQNLHLDTSQK